MSIWTMHLKKGMDVAEVCPMPTVGRVSLDLIGGSKYEGWKVELTPDEARALADALITAAEKAE